jgi:hypothetical protein
LYDIELFSVFQQTANPDYCGFTNFRIDSVVVNQTGVEITGFESLFEIYDNGTFRIIDFSLTFDNYTVSVSVFNNDTSYGIDLVDATSKWSNGTTNQYLIDISLYDSSTPYTPPRAPIFTSDLTDLEIDLALQDFATEVHLTYDLSSVLSMANLDYDVSVTATGYNESYVTFDSEDKSLDFDVNRIGSSDIGSYEIDLVLEDEVGNMNSDY